MISIENGGVSSTGTVDVGEVVIYSCRDGYTLNGARARECFADGTLSDSMPSCDRGKSKLTS